MLEPKYSAFLRAALAISDDYERGLIKSLSGFDLWCQSIATEIASKKVDLASSQTEIELPLVLQKSFNALLKGVIATIEKYPSVSTIEGCKVANP